MTSISKEVFIMKKKKALAVFLAAVMLTAMFPISAFSVSAAETETNYLT